jgi:hypothetical protein
MAALQDRRDVGSGGVALADAIITLMMWEASEPQHNR